MPQPFTGRLARAQTHARRLAKQACRNCRHSYTPEQAQLRTLRDLRRRYASCGTTAWHHYAHWLNELLSGRRAGQPCPLGKELGRIFLNHVRAAHRRSLNAIPITYPLALA